MSDLISRQAAIDMIDKILPSNPMKNEYTQGITCGAALAMEYIKQLPSAQPEQKEPCSACEGLEDGDTLYAHSDWDGGIGFDYIRDIKYCPVCGRRLL